MKLLYVSENDGIKNPLKFFFMRCDHLSKFSNKF